MAQTHGRRSTYRRGCRCELCREANRDAMRRYRERSAGRGSKGPAVAPSITAVQLRQSFVHRGRLGYGRRSARDRWLAACSAFVGRELSSTKDLGLDEADQLLFVLRSCRDEAELRLQVAASELRAEPVEEQRPAAAPALEPATSASVLPPESFDLFDLVLLAAVLIAWGAVSALRRLRSWHP